MKTILTAAALLIAATITAQTDTLKLNYEKQFEELDFRIYKLERSSLQAGENLVRAKDQFIAGFIMTAVGAGVAAYGSTDKDLQALQYAGAGLVVAGTIVMPISAFINIGRAGKKLKP